MHSVFCFLAFSEFIFIILINFCFFKDLQISENLTRYESKTKRKFSTEKILSAIKILKGFLIYCTNGVGLVGATLDVLFLLAKTSA